MISFIFQSSSRAFLTGTWRYVGVRSSRTITTSNRRSDGEWSRAYFYCWQMHGAKDSYDRRLPKSLLRRDSAVDDSRGGNDAQNFSTCDIPEPIFTLTEPLTCVYARTSKIVGNVAAGRKTWPCCSWIWHNMRAGIA